MRETSSAPIRNAITGNLYIWAALMLCLLLAGALYLPLLRNVLGLVPPAVEDWLIILAVGLVPLLLGQIARQVKGAKLKSEPPRNSAKENG